MPRWSNPIDMDQFHGLVKQDLSAQEIAAQLGISRQRVYQLLSRAGISLKKIYRPRLSSRGPRKQMARIVTGIDQMNSPRISSGNSGRICELLVAADLMARGWKIFFPLNGHGPHDLIASKKYILKSFEARAARRSKNGAILFKKDAERDRSDHYALVVRGEPVIYDPDID